MWAWSLRAVAIIIGVWPVPILLTKMAAASTTGSVPMKVDSKKIVPTLLRIERSKGYLPGSDKHYRYAYLAERLVTGMERNKLESKKLSQMYSVFENQHGLMEAIALVSFLFRVCDDMGSAEEIEALVGQSDSGLRFCGRRVNEEEREKFNIRTLFARLAAELDEEKQKDFITMLQSHIDDSESKNTDFKTILVLMTKACNSGVLTAQNLSAQLNEWLELLGFSEDGDFSIMKEITNFDSKKQFPGCEL